jgi:putative transposase
LLPKDFAPWQTVYGYFRRWTKAQVWSWIHDTLRERVRRKVGKKPSPTAAIMDSQSVKTGDQGGASGYDAGKKIKGRKRHLLVDTLGLILGLWITPADVQDRDGAKGLLMSVVFWFCRLKVIWADAGYLGELVQWVKQLRPFGALHLEIVKRSEEQKGFKVLRKRWIVERTFGWFVKCRRLVRDYEKKITHSEALIQICMIGLMLRRLDKSSEF